MGNFIGTHFQSDQNFSKQNTETTLTYFLQKKANKQTFTTNKQIPID